MNTANETATPRVWGVGTARTLRVHWTLEELGVDYTHEPILTRSAEMKRADFRALSQREKLPMLEHGALVMGESAAISLYLSDTYRKRAELTPPHGTPERALHDELCFFIMTEMDALLYVLRRHEGLPDIYGASETACDAARTYFLRSLSEIERRIASRPETRSLGSTDFCIADILAHSCVMWARVVGIEIPESLTSVR